MGGAGHDDAGANVWVLTCRRRCSRASSAGSVGQLIELTPNGQPIKRLPVADPTTLTGGAGAIWIAHFDTGDVWRVHPRTGQTTATTHLQFPKPIATNGWRRFEPSGINFEGVTSATTAGALTWVADELDGVGTFAAGSDHVAIHLISWARQPVDVQSVAHGAGLIWALGAQTSYLASLTSPTTVGVLTTLGPRTGKIVHQWRVSPDAVALVLGNGGAYVGDDNHRRLLRLTAPHGVQTLHGPTAARLTSATTDALWAINRNGQLLRIGLAHR